jgi:hypothetical protein
MRIRRPRRAAGGSIKVYAIISTAVFAQIAFVVDDGLAPKDSRPALGISKHRSIIIISECPLGRRSWPIVRIRRPRRAAGGRIKVNAIIGTAVLAHVAFVVDDGLALEDGRSALGISKQRSIKVGTFGGTKKWKRVAAGNN